MLNKTNEHNVMDVMFYEKYKLVARLPHTF